MSERETEAQKFTIPMIANATCRMTAEKSLKNGRGQELRVYVSGYDKNLVNRYLQNAKLGFVVTPLTENDKALTMFRDYPPSRDTTRNISAHTLPEFSDEYARLTAEWSKQNEAIDQCYEVMKQAWNLEEEATTILTALSKSLNQNERQELNTHLSSIRGQYAALESKLSACHQQIREFVHLGHTLDHLSLETIEIAFRVLTTNGIPRPYVLTLVADPDIYTHEKHTYQALEDSEGATGIITADAGTVSARLSSDQTFGDAFTADVPPPLGNRAEVPLPTIDRTGIYLSVEGLKQDGTPNGDPVKSTYHKSMNIAFSDYEVEYMKAIVGPR